jgi:hypothetical protein
MRTISILAIVFAVTLNICTVLHPLAAISIAAMGVAIAAGIVRFLRYASCEWGNWTLFDAGISLLINIAVLAIYRNEISATFGNFTVAFICCLPNIFVWIFIVKFVRMFGVLVTLETGCIIEACVKDLKSLVSRG